MRRKRRMSNPIRPVLAEKNDAFLTVRYPYNAENDAKTKHFFPPVDVYCGCKLNPAKF